MQIYYVYILTDRHRRVLYTGKTNNLDRRIHEHRTQRTDSAYSARYGLHYLVYFERHHHPAHASVRERVIKQMSREQRNALIRAFETEESSRPPQLRNPYAPPGWAEARPKIIQPRSRPICPW